MQSEGVLRSETFPVKKQLVAVVASSALIVTGMVVPLQHWALHEAQSFGISQWDQRILLVNPPLQFMRKMQNNPAANRKQWRVWISY